MGMDLTQKKGIEIKKKKKRKNKYKNNIKEYYEIQ